MTLTTTPAEIVARAEAANPGLLAREPSWPRVEVGELVRVVNGAPFSSRLFNTQGRGEPLIRIRDVGSTGSATFYDGPFEDSMRVEAGDLIVGMDGDFRLARWAGPPALLNQRVCKLDVMSPQLDPRWLLHCLPGYLDAIWAETSSVTVKHLSSRTIAQVPLPLPPLEEQRRIVDLLEDHLSRLEAAMASVLRARRRLDSLEQSVLAYCYHLGELRALGSLAEIQGGIQKQPKRAPAGNAFPFLRVANVTARGLDLEEVHQVELFDGEIERLRLQDGDLLVVEGNGSPSQIGRAAVWNGEIADCVHQNHLIRVRPQQALSPTFLEAVWNAPQNRRQLTDLSSSSSGLHTLSVGKLKTLKIPVASESAQQEAITRVGEVRATRRRLQADLNAVLVGARRLRRALLGAAFAGELSGRPRVLEGPHV